MFPVFWFRICFHYLLRASPHSIIFDIRCLYYISFHVIVIITGMQSCKCDRSCGFVFFFFYFFSYVSCFNRKLHINHNTDNLFIWCMYRYTIENYSSASSACINFLLFFLYDDVSEHCLFLNQFCFSVIDDDEGHFLDDLSMNDRKCQYSFLFWIVRFSQRPDILQ